MSLRDLYQEIIIDHSHEPRNFGKLQKAPLKQVGHNPLCGDKLLLYVCEVNKIVVDIRFEGEGCAICMASASLMTEAVKGKHVDAIETLFQAFHKLATEGIGDEAQLGKLAVFSHIAHFPIRVKCATLAWHTLKAALKHQHTIITTE